MKESKAHCLPNNFKYQGIISLIKPSRGALKPDFFIFLTDFIIYLFILISYDSAQMSETSTQECAKKKKKFKGVLSSYEKFK